jgi:hypothetical protein
MLRYNAAVDDRPIWPRNPWPDIPRPLSNFYPEAQLQDINNGAESPDSPPTYWTPFGFLQSRPFLKGGSGVVGSATVRRTDFYDSSPNAWPNNGQWDKPNGFFAELLRLKTHTSAHPGKNMPTGGGPTMYFKAPPVFSMQTKPIPAVGI